MRVVVAVVLVALAGCAAPSTPDLDPPDVALFAILEAEGDLPSWYVVQVREFQDNVPLQQQDGRVLWEAEGQVRPGTNETEAHALAAGQPYWIVVRFDRTPELARTANASFSFKLDPAACEDLVNVRATGRSSLTQWGGWGTVSGCGP